MYIFLSYGTGNQCLMFQHSKQIGKFRLQGEDGLDRPGGDDIVEKLLPISAGEYKQTSLTPCNYSNLNICPKFKSSNLCNLTVYTIERK